MMTKFTSMFAAVVVVALIGCGDEGPTGPTKQPAAISAPPLSLSKSALDDELEYWANAPGAPSLANPTVSFYAVKGRRVEISIWYHAPLGSNDSTEFLRFRVDGGSLFKRPDGTRFAAGDSILITATVVDTAKLIVDFQPSGLQFDPKRPARLWFKWTETDPDYNHDGVVDATDTAELLASSIWKQETPGDPWESLNSVVAPSSETFEAKITGFTRYLVAY